MCFSIYFGEVVTIPFVWVPFITRCDEKKMLAFSNSSLVGRRTGRNGRTPWYCNDKTKLFLNDCRMIT